MGNWDGIPGQRKVKEFLIRSAERSQISHAYILEGEPGTPGPEMAEAFARMLQCERGTGCGVCRSCRIFDEHNHPDVIRIQHEKPKIISVREIREQLVNDMRILPYDGPWKIYLVPEAEKLTDQAQNALLKTLEEPPGYGLVILITDNAEKLLPTIRSRSVCLKLQSEGEGTELLDGEMRAEILSVLKRAPDADRAEFAAAAAAWKKSGIPVSYLVNLIRVWIRDILVWKDTGQESLLALRDEVQAVRGAAERYSYRALGEILAMADRTERRIAVYVNYEHAMEELLAKMRAPVRAEEDDGGDFGFFPDFEEARAEYESYLATTEGTE